MTINTKEADACKSTTSTWEARDKNISGLVFESAARFEREMLG